MQKKRNIIPLNETYNEVDTSKCIKSYMFIKGFAVAKNHWLLRDISIMDSTVKMECHTLYIH